MSLSNSTTIELTKPGRLRYDFFSSWDQFEHGTAAGLFGSALRDDANGVQSRRPFFLRR